ncbi:ExbD/TolR family protein [Spongiimicrobium salis]|uniref:ExbD/TolR family protein n=1 Tax=Spongiimicrobium salis TaxID=1667022 RepID=UPI00374D0C51
MSKFKKKPNGDVPKVSTASLPDIVFMLLFFFMTVTVMKDTTLKVENTLPNASEIKKLEKQDRLIYIHIGKPTQEYRRIAGEEPVVQMNESFLKLNQIGARVLEEIGKKPQHIQPFVTVVLKVDRTANMGLISDVKEELRKVNALKINYTTYDGDAFENF